MLKTYLSFSLSKSYNHCTVKMRTGIKIMLFWGPKDGRILNSLFLIQLFPRRDPAACGFLCDFKNSRDKPGLMPSGNGCGTELLCGLAEIPCLCLRYESRFKAFSCDENGTVLNKCFYQASVGAKCKRNSCQVAFISTSWNTCAAQGSLAGLNRPCSTLGRSEGTDLVMKPF